MFCFLKEQGNWKNISKFKNTFKSAISRQHWMLPCSGCPLCGCGLPSRSGSGRHSCSHRHTAALTALLGSRGRGPPPQLQVNMLDVVRLQMEVRPGWTSRLRVCLVCGLASQLLSLIADKRKSFEFKESNHCSCYEATI